MLLERNDNQRPRKFYSKKLLIREKGIYYQKENQGDGNKPNFKKLEKQFTEETKISLDFTVTETEKVRQANLRNILSHELSKSIALYREDFLSKH